MVVSFVKVISKERLKDILEIFLVAVFFIISSYLVQKNITAISEYIGDGFIGAGFYVLILVIATVIAPVNAVPLIPLAAQLWGVFLAALLNITGWLIGAMIAFIISRKYGVNLIGKFLSIDKINKLEALIPKKNVFWAIVFLRMSIPVDILSYALGLFTKISLRKYLLATLIGIIPFAFILSYLGVVSFKFQIIALLLALIIIFIGAFLVFYRKKVLKSRG